MMLSDLLAVCGTITIPDPVPRGTARDLAPVCSRSGQRASARRSSSPRTRPPITQMVPKEHYARAGGLMSLAEDGSVILAPILAGLLIGIIRVGGILTIDIVTFGFAFGALLLIDVPSPVREEKPARVHVAADDLWVPLHRISSSTAVPADHIRRYQWHREHCLSPGDTQWSWHGPAMTRMRWLWCSRQPVSAASWVACFMGIWGRSPPQDPGDPARQRHELLRPWG